MSQLTVTDVQSPVWMKLATYYRERLQQLREQNDGEMAPEQRQKHVGRIAEVKALLSMERTLVPLA